MEPCRATAGAWNASGSFSSGKAGCEGQSDVTKRRLLERLDLAWQSFRSSYAGMSTAELLEPGVTGNWSVRDIIAHVTSWEEEALTHLPHVLAGRRPPKYSVKYGGIDKFNALTTGRKQDLTLAEVLAEQKAIH